MPMWAARRAPKINAHRLTKARTAIVFAESGI